MSALEKLARISEQDYLAFELTAECRHEYVDGYIYAMAGASERHNRVSMNLGFHLRAAARGGRCGVFLNDMKLSIEQGRTYYYPDVMLVCNPDDNGQLFKEQPCLLAEVLSSGTAAIDRREKLMAYQKIPSLRYYLIVASDRQHVDYYVRDSNGDWQTAILEADEILVVDCDAYHAKLSLADIYEDVVFD
ncbi:MAG: Uma2 family endonuclease [Methylovulum sp.]|uniref:Uma2 family endonuclease n=1 Tax=Methylovulum sp. TaxID=1916980 RepID=UPI00260F0556|nr:Uma2 family endonuclease [Methylovulum sp.]MDD2723399.1 Uma2 family endonuclease [Methylovulum sp.]MDD5125066.1 Uma2 family endonuclease [Methylovulum sp.]